MNFLKTISVLFPSLLLISCSSPSTERPEQERPPAALENYIASAREGDWDSVCQLLARQEKSRIEKFFQSSCSKGLAGSPQGKSLQERAKTMRAGDIQSSNGLWKVSLSPAGTIWIKNNRIYFSEP